MTSTQRVAGGGASVSVHLALVAVQILFGLHYVAAKIVLAELPPRAWACLRAVGAAVLLLALVRITGRRLSGGYRTLTRIASLSLLGVVVNQLCFVEGLARTTTLHSALINTTIPVATLVFAATLGRERLHWRRIAAISCATLGVLCIIQPWTVPAAPAVQIGDGLTLLNALSYALFLVLSKPTLDRTDPLPATAALMACGAVVLLLPGAGSLAASDLTRVQASTWALAAGIIVGPTALAYLLSYWALRQVDASAVAFYVFLQPLLAVLMGILVLGEQPGFGFYGGALAVGAGVWLIARSPATDRRARI